MLAALALACVTPDGLLAQDDQAKAMPPSVASVLRWLPEETETLVVARNDSLPGPHRARDWQDAGASLACEDLFVFAKEPQLRELWWVARSSFFRHRRSRTIGPKMRGLRRLSVDASAKPGENTARFVWQIYRRQAFELFLADE